MKKNQKKLFILMVLYNAITLISLLLPISNEMKAITLILCLIVDSLCSTFLKGGYEAVKEGIKRVLKGILDYSIYVVIGIIFILVYTPLAEYIIEKIGSKIGYELAYQLSGFLPASVGIAALLIYAKKVSK